MGISEYVVRITISAILIVVVTEVAKRHTLLGAAIASVPLVSVLAMIWLYHDTHDTARIGRLALEIFWLVLASLPLFLLLPHLLQNGMGFYPALLLSMTASSLCYGVLLYWLPVLTSRS